jgi:aerobic-type carbon monoxide dehydrogenase small subunit (CoxS/CutS family)
MTMAKISLTINGVKRQVEVSPEKVLLDLLRQDLYLTGTKQSCDRKGQCDACTVIVNGKAVRLTRRPPGSRRRTCDIIIIVSHRRFIRG